MMSACREQPSSFSIDSTWYFVAGDSTEGLHPKALRSGQEKVSLPHRILRPNTPLWYRAEVDFPSSGVLGIRADDGAQLFINNSRVLRLHDDYFPVEGGKATVVVRVLNNAMNGGLRSVHFMTTAAHDRYLAELDSSRRARHQVEQRTIIGPWLTKEADNTFIIRAMTDEEQTVTLAYGPSESDLSTTVEQTGKIFRFELPPGQPSIVYYTLTCRGKVTPVYHFATTEQAKFSFNAWADSQSGWEAFRQNLDHLSEPRDAFGIGAGDLVGDGSDYEEWRSFYDVLSTHSPYMPFYLIAGNHDYDGFYDSLDPVYYRQLNRFDGHSYYSFTYSNCAFIMLDPNETFPIDIGPGSKQYEWFQQVIRSQQWLNATWRFVVLHQPPYSQGWEGYTGDHFLRRLLDPVAQSTGIDFIITGHTHDYERLVMRHGSNETIYLIMGGGGGSLEPPASSAQPKMDRVIKRHHIGRFYVDGKSIRVEVIGEDGKVMDGLERRK